MHAYTQLFTACAIDDEHWAVFWCSLPNISSNICHKETAAILFNISDDSSSYYVNIIFSRPGDKLWLFAKITLSLFFLAFAGLNYKMLAII